MSCPVCKKYNISEQSYRNMIAEGVLSTTIDNWNRVIETYERHKVITGSTSEAVKITCEETGTCRSRVYEIIARFK